MYVQGKIHIRHCRAVQVEDAHHNLNNTSHVSKSIPGAGPITVTPPATPASRISFIKSLASARWCTLAAVNAWTSVQATKSAICAASSTFLVIFIIESKETPHEKSHSESSSILSVSNGTVRYRGFLRRAATRGKVGATGIRRDNY